MTFLLPENTWDEVAARYGEPWRRYHDRRHLLAVLDHARALASEHVNLHTVNLGALFHDAVYVPGREDNESKSAQLASSVLAGAGAPPPLIDEVVRLVLLTTHHDVTREGPARGATDPRVAAERDPEGAVMCDADLAILGASPRDYAAYAADVRAEWPHLDDAKFSAGRIQVLSTLLDRPWLYTTATARERWETNARHNLETELTRLRTRT